MSQDFGPDDEPQGAGDPAADLTAPKKRPTSWQWLALAILLLVVIWLIWQYLGDSDTGSDTASTSVSSETTLTPGGGASGLQPTESVDAGEPAEQGPFVPDVVGMSRAEAISTLQAAGYQASVTDVYGTSKPAGTVFQQNPTGGTLLSTGDTVGLLVQLRPASTSQVTVPELTGLSQSEAQRKLAALGLKVVLSYFPDAGDPGRVHSQWPLAGDPVATGGGVQIQVTVKP